MICSTSSGGNQVDGLPRAQHNTETLAKQARVGPRTPVLLTMKKLFLMIISSTHDRGSDMIVSDNILNIWMELVNCRNDNATEKFYRVQVV